jgi:hypothetical protein
MSLHNTRSFPQFVTTLFNELAVIKPPRHQGNASHGFEANAWPPGREEGTVLSSLAGEGLSRAKSLLLTLHCLFPSELLLALDIIDKRLLTRVIILEEEEEAKKSNNAAYDSNTRRSRRSSGIAHDYSEGHGSRRQVEEIYYAKSTSVTRGIPKSYEIRLHAWNCTCPAFVLNIFGVAGHSAVYNSTDTLPEEPNESCQWWFDRNAFRFGGTLTRNSGPLNHAVCKHILACVLSSQCPSLFEHGIRETRVVSSAELAGLCGG